MGAAFEYRQAQEIRDAFARHGVRYLFLGKSGAILLGFPDTTQDADLFVEKTADNARRVVAALREMQFTLTDEQSAEIARGKDFVHSRTDRSISISSSRPTASSGSRTLGPDGSTSRDFPCAIPTTSSRASGRRTGSRTASRCRGWSRFATTG